MRCGFIPRYISVWHPGRGIFHIRTRQLSGHLSVFICKTETIQSRPNDRVYERSAPPPSYPSASFAPVHSEWEIWVWVWGVWASPRSSFSSCVSLTLDVRGATWEANVAACSSMQARICSRVRRRSANVSPRSLLFLAVDGFKVLLGCLQTLRIVCVLYAELLEKWFLNRWTSDFSSWQSPVFYKLRRLLGMYNI